MPTHKFLLLPENEGDYAAYAQHVSDPRALKVSDDLIRYMLDTLNWIPSINPANQAAWNGYGLNYYGPTVINKTGAPKAARIFLMWGSLFQEGPDKIELTGSYQWLEGAPESSGQYEKITMPRESIAKTILDLAELAEGAISGEFYLLHVGI
ncbi:hypothetical protein LOC68_08090 [Blastopirellula sp. JC732]|uniref:Uncharacterized protein n=1 Tax=Blastopirellula sediminis TaxID=2894196 RepID=A0A9X1MKP7_9BACT|nr:hypothetical protein [Blastopirellula sediminis]MCC9608872.1 hypothetical protein [Blastopirellula sediminis]MCC9628351.1 hypothetical protein [Blastopirellula sediminis]